MMVTDGSRSHALVVGRTKRLLGVIGQVRTGIERVCHVHIDHEPVHVHRTAGLDHVKLVLELLIRIGQILHVPGVQHQDAATLRDLQQIEPQLQSAQVFGRALLEKRIVARSRTRGFDDRRTGRIGIGTERPGHVTRDALIQHETMIIQDGAPFVVGEARELVIGDLGVVGLHFVQPDLHVPIRPGVAWGRIHVVVDEEIGLGAEVSQVGKPLGRDEDLPAHVAQAL